MSAPDASPFAPRPLPSPRAAQKIAEELRRRIMSGQLADGDLLPTQAAMVELFNVSLVSLREALRILQTEGLVSVRRGNRGGAVVHAPAHSTAAYMLALILQSDDVRLSDLAAALQEFEPMCAALGAQRPDRLTQLVPQLQHINEAMDAGLTDDLAFTEMGRRFHHLLVRGCGNHTLTAVVGSLEDLWTSHEQHWAARSAAAATYPSMRERAAILKTHRALTEAIECGHVQRARHIATRHLADAHIRVVPDDPTRPIDAMSVRARI